MTYTSNNINVFYFVIRSIKRPFIGLCMAPPLLALLVYGVMGCSGEASGGTAQRTDDQSQPNDRSIRKVSTAQAEAVEHRTTWEVRGVLEPSKTARAAFILGGRLRKVMVERGDVVSEGDVLARLDTSEVGAGIAQARAALAATQAQVKLADDALSRLERLISQHAVAEAEVVKVRIQREAAMAMQAQAQAAVQMASVKSGQHVLRSPMAGTILDVPERLGEIIGPGIPQFEIADLSKLRFRGTLPGEAAGRIELGQKISAARRTGAHIEGHINYISPALNSDTHRLPFEAEFDPPSEANQGVANSYVLISVDSETAITVSRIPASCLVRGEDTVVFVVTDDGVAHRHVVTVARSMGDQVLVEGIEAGSDVIVLPQVDLIDGARVER